MFRRNKWHGRRQQASVLSGMKTLCPLVIPIQPPKSLDLVCDLLVRASASCRQDPCSPAGSNCTTRAHGSGGIFVDTLSPFPLPQTISHPRQCSAWQRNKPQRHPAAQHRMTPSPGRAKRESRATPKGVKGPASRPAGSLPLAGIPPLRKDLQEHGAEP